MSWRRAPVIEGRILELNGAQDGIRWGRISINSRAMCFHHDRLSGAVRLYRMDANDSPIPVKCQRSLAIARASLEAAWAEERAR